MADQAFVAGEQPGNRRNRERCHAENASRHMHGFLQRAFQGHVHTMVVARRQVDGGERTIAVGDRRRFVAQQFSGAVVLALGLEDTPVNDAAGLADTTVGRRQQGRRIGIGRPCIGSQLAGEEGIEVLIGQRIRLRGLGHVDVVVAHDGTDQPVLPGSEGPAGGPVDHARQSTVRKYVLQDQLECHRTSIRAGCIRWPYNGRSSVAFLDRRDRRTSLHH
jgi:hypothetical protein